MYTSQPQSDFLQRFEFNAKFTRLLGNLKNLKKISLGGGVEALRIEVPFSKGLQGNTLYIRSFYSSLFDAIMERNDCILMGNPGISKSWFQLYMLYRFINDTSKRIVNIVRQVGNQVTLINLEQGKAFTCSNKEGYYILEFLKPEKAYYIVEPKNFHEEPHQGEHTIKTCITASPDERRFKEFHKSGAVKLYMPVWKLEELHIVGKDVVANTTCERTKRMLTEQQIEERFRRFGGIIRYVISASDDYIQDMQSNQATAISHTKPADIYVDGDNITNMDQMKSNVSHFVLQYHVYMDVPNLFREFRMCYASAYVQEQIRRKMTIGDIHHSGKKIVRSLQHIPPTCTYMYGRTQTTTRNEKMSGIQMMSKIQKTSGTPVTQKTSGTPKKSGT